MSHAYKCDRCGALYERNIELYIHKHYICLENHPYSDTEIDLCPNCQVELEKWLEERKESNE